MLALKLIHVSEKGCCPLWDTAIKILKLIQGDYEMLEVDKQKYYIAYMTLENPCPFGESW